MARVTAFQAVGRGFESRLPLLLIRRRLLELNRRRRSMAKEKFDRVKAARERGNDRTHRSREDDVDGVHHEGAGEAQSEEQVPVVRLDRQRAGREGARNHDRDGARGVRDLEAALRARGLPGSRRLHQEHDHGSGADGRGDPGGGGDRRADAADAGAHPAGAAGGRALHRGVSEQVRCGGRCRSCWTWWSWKCGTC